MVVASDFGEVGMLCLTAPLSRAAPVTGQRTFEQGHYAGEFTFPRPGLYTLFVSFLPTAMAHGSAAAEGSLNRRRRLTAMEGMAHDGMAGHSMHPSMEIHSTHMEHHGHMDHRMLHGSHEHTRRVPSPLENPKPFVRTLKLQINVTERMAVVGTDDGMPLPHHARHSRKTVQSQLSRSQSPLVPWPALYEGMDDEDGGGFNRTRPADMEGEIGVPHADSHAFTVLVKHGPSTT